VDNNNVKNIALESLAAMNAAITSARLYPSGSALIVNSVQRLYLLLASLFEQVDAVIYAESEKNLLIEGEPLSEKEQKRPQVVSFVSLMLDFGIRSLSIQ
jgi:transcriptional regulator with AAA-type ATPase domain